MWKTRSLSSILIPILLFLSHKWCLSVFGFHHPRLHRPNTQNQVGDQRTHKRKLQTLTRYHQRTGIRKEDVGLFFHPSLVVMGGSSSSHNENDETGNDGNSYSSCKIGPITESSFPGAGLPRPELTPEEIPPLLMQALELNDFPEVDSGLTSVWDFAGDTTRHIFQQNRTEFIESAHDTASEMPTSFYGVAMKGQSWSMETELNRIGGEQGWIATQVMKTISSDGRLRRWQWELRKQKRPPHLNCWYVESIGSSDRKGQFEADS